MNIILEGPDGAGKSTLAKALAERIGWPIKVSEGKPATWHLTLERFRKYEALNRMIIDRHPIYSQQIYGPLRGDPEIPEEFIENFLDKGPKTIFVYCRAINTKLMCHEPKPTDTIGHLNFIEENYEEILDRYDRLAAHCAEFIYHEYRYLPVVVEAVAAAVQAMEEIDR